MKKKVIVSFLCLVVLLCILSSCFAGGNEFNKEYAEHGFRYISKESFKQYDEKIGKKRKYYVLNLEYTLPFDICGSYDMVSYDIMRPYGYSMIYEVETIEKHETLNLFTGVFYDHTVKSGMKLYIKVIKFPEDMKTKNRYSIKLLKEEYRNTASTVFYENMHMMDEIVFYI